MYNIINMVLGEGSLIPILLLKLGVITSCYEDQLKVLGKGQNFSIAHGNISKLEKKVTIIMCC